MANVLILTETTTASVPVNVRLALERKGHTVTILSDELVNIDSTNYDLYDVVFVSRPRNAAAELAGRYRKLIDGGKPFVIQMGAAGMTAGTGFSGVPTALNLTGTFTLESTGDEIDVTDAGHTITGILGLGRKAIIGAQNWSIALTTGQGHVGTALATGDPDIASLTGRIALIAVPAYTADLVGSELGGNVVVLGGPWGHSAFTVSGDQLLHDAVQWAIVPTAQPANTIRRRENGLLTKRETNKFDVNEWDVEPDGGPTKSIFAGKLRLVGDTRVQWQTARFNPIAARESHLCITRAIVTGSHPFISALCRMELPLETYVGHSHINGTLGVDLTNPDVYGFDTTVLREVVDGSWKGSAAIMDTSYRRKKTDEHMVGVGVEGGRAYICDYGKTPHFVNEKDVVALTGLRASGGGGIGVYGREATTVDVSGFWYFRSPVVKVFGTEWNQRVELRDALGNVLAKGEWRTDHFQIPAIQFAFAPASSIAIFDSAGLLLETYAPAGGVLPGDEFNSTWPTTAEPIPTTGPATPEIVDDVRDGSFFTLLSSPFTHPDSRIAHARSHWQVVEDTAPDWGAPVHEIDSATDLTRLDWIVLCDVVYRARVRYLGSNNVWSAWSPQYAFNLPPVSPARPPAGSGRELYAEFNTATHSTTGASITNRPDAVTVDYRIAYAMGPGTLGSAVDLYKHVWRLEVEGASVYLTRANTTNNAWDARSLFLTLPWADAVECDLAFDQQGRVVACFERGGRVHVYFYDGSASAYTLLDAAAGRTPRLVMDDPEGVILSKETDVVLFYLAPEVVDPVTLAVTRVPSLCYRQQRDRYGVEYVHPTGESMANFFLEDAVRVGGRVEVMMSQRDPVAGTYVLRRFGTRLYPYLPREDWATPVLSLMKAERKYVPQPTPEEWSTPVLSLVSGERRDLVQKYRAADEEWGGAVLAFQSGALATVLIRYEATPEEWGTPVLSFVGGELVTV